MPGNLSVLEFWPWIPEGQTAKYWCPFLSPADISSHQGWIIILFSFLPLVTFPKISEDISTPKSRVPLWSSGCSLFILPYCHSAPRSLVLNVGSVDPWRSPKSDYFHNNTKMSLGFFFYCVNIPWWCKSNIIVILKELKYKYLKKIILISNVNIDITHISKSRLRSSTIFKGIYSL